MDSTTNPHEDLIKIVTIALGFFALIGDMNMRIIVITIWVVLLISYKIYELQRDNKINKEQ
ncbi:MAG: hypothetical protein J0M18_12530 [Ignavibacteria bacterium]|nr:hypothetical protein [Ignavibacteria bacterium]